MGSYTVRLLLMTLDVSKVPARQWPQVWLHLMQPLNQEIVNDHTKDIGHRRRPHERRMQFSESTALQR
jgi:hypothetical protein